MVTGSRAEEVLRVLDGDAPSLAAGGTFDVVGAGLAEIEVAGLVAGADCDRGAGDLEKPEQSGYFVHGDDDALVGRLAFEDAETAAADLEARTAYFETGPLGEDEAPLDSYGTYELAQDGPIVSIALHDMDSQTMRSLTLAPGSFLGC
ncbi:hypothetical protein [Nocardioides sp.]|uniref:hypothetical protein n=1 Tax=Nocardioides sp. TaxID=35761 RepID=UPI002B27BE3A|nr:hypothetical protein [Nocardioides sp.]